jgi:hypothetical protein
MGGATHGGPNSLHHSAGNRNNDGNDRDNIDDDDADCDDNDRLNGDILQLLYHQKLNRQHDQADAGPQGRTSNDFPPSAQQQRQYSAQGQRDL